MIFFRLLLGLTAMIMLGGPSQGRKLETRSRNEPPDISFKDNGVDAPNRLVRMDILPWTIGFQENRITGSNDAFENELVTQSTNDGKAVTATTDQGTDSTELEKLRLNGDETGDGFVESSAADMDLSTDAIEASKSYRKTPGDLLTLPGITVEIRELFDMTPGPGALSTVGNLAEASGYPAKNPAIDSSTFTTGIGTHAENPTFGSVDGHGTIDTKSPTPIHPSEESKTSGLPPAPTSVIGKADYKARAILLFLMASLIIMPMKTTMFRIGNACHASKLAFWNHVVYSAMICAFITAALLLEKVKILGTENSGQTVITDILGTREGVFWCGLAGISVLSGVAMPLTRTWNDWTIFVCGLSGDLAFVLSCYMEQKYQLMSLAKDEAQKTLDMLINYDGKIENWNLTSEDLVFILVCYGFVNLLLEYARKRETKASIMPRRVICDEETGFGEMNGQQGCGNGTITASTVVSTDSTTETVPVPKPESTVINMEDTMGDN